MFEQAVLTVYGIVWGPILLALLLGTGIYLTLGLKGMTIRKIPYAFRQLLKGRKGSGEGEVTPFNALMTSLSSTVGTGNIAGVATAISLGGPGALFWMWLTALVGMATKYAEAVLAVNYRETDERGKKVGGPMYYIKNGLGDNWKFLGILFAIFGSIAGFGLANTVQSHEVSKVLAQNYSIPTHYSGIVMAVLVGMVLLGGIKRIGAVAGKLVPLMTIVYVISTVFILASYYEAIPSAIALIMDSAFNGMAATGGFAGAAMIAGLRAGVARGIFSNESGLGSAPIAHAAAETNSPVRQGTIAMLGTFIDTIIICTMTGLILVASGAWNGDLVGANMTRSVFTSTLPFGDTIFTLSLVLFAFTTMLGWSYYGERCAEFLFGPKVITPYRILWVVGIYVGTQMQGGIVWKLADILNGMMAFPNLIAVLFLSPVVFKLTREYFAEEENMIPPAPVPASDK
ncbi:sodium:alanine symporter family protein [Porticoccaceae bacterium]|jgi:AGCS family alanine or glycine:cation symporter|nr:sodium:alanine symporter family protein [Porticoccaceae bacterium]CAI8362337.1 MAG: Amino-acid carrier protein AlsT [SAR92 bacterium MED-G29]MDA9345825.1 sodium:alanine symporter family protein [Porticoccaceae bacterium]MDB9843340.1 sodium:alanine symporter family protein [Porticoccaceae bacterium]MDC0133669.1 sodium:alanine symporter family protein [Porticoccaceae bacterium]|tara:strand:- start:17087 stop:18457 length:1371 start_codon:yes stop_codon:yes gene_type:complete